jgi:hypothetical protein
MSRVFDGKGCPFETDILDAVASGRWPDRADAELRDHAASCYICTEVAMISALYRDDFSTALQQAQLPSAGLVWWKAELRSRREAVRVASRPITLVAGIAGICALGVLALAIMGLSRQLNIASVSAFILEQPMVLWLVLAVIVALTPIAIYFVYSDE